MLKKSFQYLTKGTCFLFALVIASLLTANPVASSFCLKEVKETREAKQEECKVCEDDDASELYKVIFKNKVLKLSSPPEPIKTYCIKVIALSALKKFAADTICNSFSYPCLIDIFGNIPRYIAFHSLIFYEV